MWYSFMKKHFCQNFSSSSQAVFILSHFENFVKYRPWILQTRIQTVITFDCIHQIVPNFAHLLFLTKCFEILYLLKKLFIHNGRLTEKKKFSEYFFGIFWSWFCIGRQLGGCNHLYFLKLQHVLLWNMERNMFTYCFLVK